MSKPQGRITITSGSRAASSANAMYGLCLPASVPKSERAARHLDERRHPIAAGHERLDPLDAPRPSGRRRPARCSRTQRSATSVRMRWRCMLALERASLRSATPSASATRCRSRKMSSSAFGSSATMRGRLATHLAAPRPRPLAQAGRAHRALRLRDDDVGANRVERVRVDAIDRPKPSRSNAHLYLRVDLGARRLAHRATASKSIWSLGAVSTGKRVTSRGWSHSCERPTSVSPAPSA